MDPQLSGKRAVVTGNSSGIGEATNAGGPESRRRAGMTPRPQTGAPSSSRTCSRGCIGRVKDIAHAVAFLASPLADFIDGANLRVDGGYETAIN